MRFPGHYYVHAYDRHEAEIPAKRCACADKALARQVARQRLKEPGVYSVKVENATGNEVYTLTAKGGAR
jgi:hypothetical protein